MFRRIGRSNFRGLRWFFSTNQQHTWQQQASFAFSQSSFTGQKGTFSDTDGANNFQQSNHEISHSIELPYATQQSDEDKNEEEKSQKTHYDVAVIGGGSGGLSFALEANRLGLSVIVFDYVDPTLKGTRWGIGGTCVNVGCIPKKLFHTASIIKENINKSIDFGFGEGSNTNFDFNSNPSSKKEQNINFRWRQFVVNVQNYISDLNLGFEAQLMNRDIPYINALATLSDSKTIHFSKDKKKIIEAISSQDFKDLSQNKITAEYIVIATGGRPSFLQSCTNSQELSISSDDLFSLKKPPGKTLIVGGGYVALECAGFISNLGFNTTVMTRNKYLKEFDQDVVKYIIDDMKQYNHVNFIDTSLPTSITKDNDKLKVCFQNQKSTNKQEEQCDSFDTVMQAVGRAANTSLLNLNKIGIKINEETRKVIGGYEGDHERTSVSNIFSLGDVLFGVPELTPPAQMAGRLLANRIFGLIHKKDKKYQEQNMMNYEGVATTVFTPLEYGCVGLSEEKAIEKFGQTDVEVYHSRFIPLEEQLSFKYTPEGNSIKRKGYAKLICQKSDSNRILGIHYLGPNAGEVLQGFAIAFKMGLFKHQVDQTVGIHPTCAEELLNMKITKSSGENFDKETC